MSHRSLPDHAHAFDFLHGAWQIANRRLATRLAGSGEWVQFPASAECRPILGGMGNIDDFRPEGVGWTGFEGGAVRIFDPHRDQWAIHWMDNVRCKLFPPVYGRFVDGVGEFLGEDAEGDQPVQVRFRWSDMTAISAEWEQAFSVDGGKTWETNWAMSMTRVS